jgi:hypothetical protein
MIQAKDNRVKQFSGGRGYVYIYVSRRLVHFPAEWRILRRLKGKRLNPQFCGINFGEVTRQFNGGVEAKTWKIGGIKTGTVPKMIAEVKSAILRI